MLTGDDAGTEAWERSRSEPRPMLAARPAPAAGPSPHELPPHQPSLTPRHAVELLSNGPFAHVAPHFGRGSGNPLNPGNFHPRPPQRAVRTRSTGPLRSMGTVSRPAGPQPAGPRSPSGPARLPVQSAANGSARARSSASGVPVRAAAVRRARSWARVRGRNLGSRRHPQGSKPS